MLPVVAIAPLLLGAARWYLKRARMGYLRANATYSEVTDSLAETVDGARTVEALGLQRRRIDRAQADLRRSYVAERYTLFLRCVFFPAVESAYCVPTALTLLFGGLGYAHGWFSLGQVTAVALYTQQIIGPIDEMLSWADRLQVGGASLARLLGVAEVPADREASGAVPHGEDIAADRTLRRTRCGIRTLPAARSCTAWTWSCARGNGWPWWARPARASRPWAGCWPASTARARGRSRWAACRWSNCRWGSCAARSRW
jgi:ABC-type multidrug transport system fused ATPase/permease subunit